MKSQRPFSWLNPKLEVKNTDKYGKGVFAIKKISKSEILAMFGGYVMTLKEEENLPESIKDLAHQIDDNFVLGINNPEERQLVDSFNHSCEPNAGFNGQIFLVAMRNIEENEEISFDYAMTLGGINPYQLNCLCEKSNCRKIITNSDWKLPTLQQKYAGYFQWYLEEKIKKLKNI